MPEKVPDHDHLGAVFPSLQRKGMPQTMATRGDPGSFGVALHLFLDRFDGQRLLGAFTVPKDIAPRAVTRMLRQALMETGHQIRGHIHVAILAPFALENA